MMDLRTIQSMAREAAKEARKNGILPLEIWPEDLDRGISLLHDIPFIGNMRPKGYKKVNEYFVDSSGFGAEDEPALTIRAFLKKLRPGYAYAVTQAGQLQVYVGEFHVVNRAKKAA